MTDDLRDRIERRILDTVKIRLGRSALATYRPEQPIRLSGGEAQAAALAAIAEVQPELDQLRERAEQAEVAIRRARRLHERYRFAGDDTTDYCTECNRLSGGWVPYPCPTITALDQPAKETR